MLFKMGKFFSAWLPPILWMGLIFFLSSFHKLQASQIGWQDFIVRKTAHFLEYAVLCFLYFRALRQTTSWSSKKSFFLALFLAFIYALSDEYHQTKVTGRTGKIFDVGVDFCGAIFGGIFFKKLIGKLPEKIKKLTL